MVVTPQQAANGAAAFAYLDDKLAAIIFLLNTGNMTPEQIAAGAACFACLDNKLGAIIYLLSTLSGGSSGGIQLVTYTAGTPSAPPDPTKSALAYDPNGFLTILGWRTSDSTWN